MLSLTSVGHRKMEKGAQLWVWALVLYAGVGEPCALSELQLPGEQCEVSMVTFPGPLVRCSALGRLKRSLFTRPALGFLQLTS